MLLHYSTNSFKRTYGIFYYNRIAIFIQLCWAAIVWLIHNQVGYDLSVSVIPVTILGGALAIFLGFRNNSAYDRWWEARKVWGAIVNVSRNFGTQVVAYIDDKEDQNTLIHRHIAWLYVLNMHLRKNIDLSTVSHYMDDKFCKMLQTAKNKPVQILHRQGKVVTELLRNGQITEFQHSMLMGDIRIMYQEQGKAERIKNTVFPFYYNYFTRLFLWVFILLLPCALVDGMNFMLIPITAMVSFVFYILDKSGEVTEEPFEGRAADTPMSSICRAIEIDMLQQIDAEDLPDTLPIQYTKYGAAYID
ncbi:MAG: hypothetical protein JXR19_11320 [Bacteroidia bacterium]